MRYVHVTPNGAFPDLASERPFRAVVVVDEPVEAPWRWELSKRLVAHGCLYMMAWGHACSKWDDDVDLAHLEAHDFDPPDDDASFVMTTWHEDESLADVLWFCRHCAHLPEGVVGDTVILDITPVARRDEITAAYGRAGESG